MTKRSAASKATRGVSKAKQVPSSSSNPKIRKFRSQYNELSVIAKGGPSKKSQNRDGSKRNAAEAANRKKFLKNLDKVNLVGDDETETSHTDGDKEIKKKQKQTSMDVDETKSKDTHLTTASFASVWSNCTNASLNEFFQVWNPNLEAHKDALAVIAGLSQTLSNTGTEQSDIEFSKVILKILACTDTPINVITGALLALTFVFRKLSKDIINANFDSFYPTLKDLIERYCNCKRKTVAKCLLRCFSCITKAHPDGKEVIEKNIRKKINLMMRQYKIQSKVKL